MNATPTDSPGTNWSDQPISPATAAEFAASVAASAIDRAAIAQNLLDFPVDIKVRGVFFDGLCRIVAAQQGEEALAALRVRAGVPARLVSFEQYEHRDFYKLYYHAARLLHSSAPFPSALRQVAQTFFPIFRSSFLGKTMAALMGEKPKTLLPLLAKAYNISVQGNEHQAVLDGDRRLVWRCTVEPVEWYEETFRGIVEGAVPAETRTTLQITTTQRQRAAGRANYTFAIRW